jgi:ABC-type multidrug transport system ATPase subunit
VFILCGLANLAEQNPALADKRLPFAELSFIQISHLLLLNQIIQNMNCIETEKLSYRFSIDQLVLNDINLQVPVGSVYGFLGPNGAGKTTTLRLLLGLLKKQDGEITVFNNSFASNRIEILRKTGSLIESPSLYGHLTAVENLLVWQKLYQCPKARIQEVLETVGLPDTGKKRTEQFSLGMKQRLSIAIALLHNPSLLILDEPTNGLDPNGIIEIRELLKKLNSQHKMTIVISSHLLSEVEKMVTHVGIINKGSLLFEGTLPELQLKQTLHASTSFETNNAAQAIEITLSLGIAVTQMNGLITIPTVEKHLIAKLNQQFVAAQIEVYRIIETRSDLESIFMDLINP